jgi:hypothetical protein
MAAEPQQMSDSQEKSDDLIAELAKLMASTAGGDGTAKPTVIKLPPLNDATIKAAPVRIPGMEAPKSQAVEAPRALNPTAPVSSTPAVRIPGMERPAGVDAAPAPQASAAAPAQQAQPVAQNKPMTQFDLGRPSPRPSFAPEPMSNWETRQPPKLPPAPPPKPAAVAQLAEMKFDPVKPIESAPPLVVTRLEPKTVAPAPMPAPVASNPPPSAAKPASNDSFGFDFGFADKDGHPRQAPVPANDPIADLITAELDAADDHDEEGDSPEAPVAAQSASSPEVLPNPIQPKPVAVTPAKPAAAAAIQIKPVNVTPRGADGDRFNVAPIHSFGGKTTPAPAPQPQVSAPPPAPAMRGDLDPMEEIENLIGEAVRVELTPADRPVERSERAPVVPPLNSGFAPRRANMRDKDTQVQSAEDAILAAAAASGAEVDRVDSPATDERPYKRMKVKPPRTSFVSSGARQYVGIAVAGTLLLAAGFGLYWVLNMGGRDDPSTAPVLTADAAPVKVTPPVAVANVAEPSGSVVFDEINGKEAADSAETLVSRDETAGASAVDVARAVTPPVEAESSESGLANRKVRTVTVRPDGTIVSGDEAVAGAEELPVDRPNVPVIEGSDIQPSDLLTAVAETQAAAGGGNASPAPAADAAADPLAALVADTDTGSATAEPLPEPDPLQVASATPQQTTPAVFDGSLVAPIPMPRPIDRDGMVGGSTQEVTATVRQANTALEPAATPLVAVQQETRQPAQQSSVSSRGGAYVQLSSQKSEGDARASLKSTQNRMASTLNGATLEIRRVDLGAKGVWYRVELPTRSFQDATQTCAAIKSNGGDCVAING